MRLRVEWVPIGEFRISRDPQVQLVTVTGPCVALALCDLEAGVAGLLHVVQPGRRRVRRSGDCHAFYADTGVPLLVEEMVNHGARRDRLQATVVGGAMASPPGNFGDLGRLNVEAVTGRLQEMEDPPIDPGGFGAGGEAHLPHGSHRIGERGDLHGAKHPGNFPGGGES